MNLATSILLLELWAGGPGSGCKGPNCGRPKKNMVIGFKAKDGAQVKVIVPKERAKKRGWVDPTKNKHPLKGEFGKPDKIEGLADLPGHEGQNLRSWVAEADKPEEAKGTTLFVYRYYHPATGKTSAVILREHPWMDEHYASGNAVLMEHRDEDKGLRLLKRRYGIEIPQREWRHGI